MLSKFRFKLAVIDLDNTLYAANNGVFARMDKQMIGYIQRELNLNVEEANILRVKYWKQYGSTLRGLMLHHGHEAEPFLFEAHDIQAHELLKPEKKLSDVLASMQVKKVIHTNGTKEHAETILKALNIREHFSDIYDIRFNAYKPKPCRETFLQMLDKEAFSPDEVMVFDDMQDNLHIAKNAGSKTAWVHPDADFQASSRNVLQAHGWDIAVPSFLSLLKG